ncbi:MAG: DUF3592 domain-containing protein [Kiritimatiellaeota bacterium]|nr:DUF3592 domain-containing protein [Kiritimatiellota bacterium]
MQLLKNKMAYFIGLTMLAGVVTFVFGVVSIFDAKKVKSWPVAQGVIIDSFVSYLEDTPANQPTNICMPDIKYEYVYKQNTFFNNNISYLPSQAIGIADFYYAAPESEVCKFLEKYPVNAKVKIHVNPLDPENSVLETGLTLPVFLPLILGLLLIYTACHLMIFHTHYFSDPHKTA